MSDDASDRDDLDGNDLATDGHGATAETREQPEATKHAVDDVLEDGSDGPKGGGRVVEMPPPNLKKTRFGLLRLWRRQKKRRKLAAKGYVEWYLIGDGYPRPKYVKPDASGGGVPELWYKGQPYLFPRNKRVPRKDSGMWVMMHKKGDAEPINLQNPEKLTIPTDELKQYLETQVTSGAPSTLDKLNISRSTIIAGVLGIIILYAVLMGGGFL